MKSRARSHVDATAAAIVMNDGHQLILICYFRVCRFYSVLGAFLFDRGHVFGRLISRSAC
jgi:hypothetical protein